MKHYRRFLICLSAILLTASQGICANLDNGVDPFNLGKGDWIWQVPQTQTAMGVTNIQGMIDYEKNRGMQWITVKCGDGGSIWTQFDTNTVMRCHAAGMKIFGWAYSYGNNVQGEINVALNALNKGADGMIIDAEVEYETNAFNGAKAIKYCQAIRQQYPNRLLAHGPSPSVHFHPTFPYLEFGTYCDIIMPQDYWGYRGITPAAMISMMDNEIRTNLYAVWSGSATNAIKPICPVAQADQPTVAAVDESDFVHLVQTDASPLTPAGYHGVSFWDAQEHTAAQWVTIANTNIALMTNVAPKIPGPPINRCVNQGSNATFRVTAYGAPTLAYQWCLAGVSVPGATNSIFTVTNAQGANAGNYTVVVSNGFGVVTSRVAVLTVVAPFPFLQPVFTDSFETNSSASWSLFQGSGNGVSDFGTNWAFSYSNQTYQSYGLSSLPTTTNIPVAPSTVGGTKLGLKLTVNKNDATAATAGISLYPATVGALSNCVFRFDAWINYAGGPNGETASGTTEMLTCGLNHTGTRVNWLDGVASSSDGTWFAVDGEGGTGSPTVGSYNPGTDYRTFKGNGASGPTHLTFTNSGLGVNGAQSEDVVDQVYRDLFCYPNYESPGTPGKHWVQVELSQYNGLLTWRMNGQVVAQRQNTSAYTNGLPMIGYLDPFGSIANPAADNFLLIDNVRIYSIIDPPLITAQPVSATNNAGTTANFNVAATGTALAYRWQKGGVNLSDGGVVSGSATASLTLTGVSQADAANYRCVITNVAGVVTSSVAVLAVVDLPTITAQPISVTNNAGTTANFSVTVNGTAPLIYQWQKGGVNLTDAGNISGSATASLTLTGVAQADAANYRCIITNAAGAVTSSVASLTVIDPPVITVQPVSLTRSAGTTANFSVTVTGTAPVFQWQKNAINLSDGGNVSGSATAALTLTGVAQSDAANYQCMITNVAGAVTSAVVSLTVIDPPVITAQPQSQVAAQTGAGVTYTVSASGTAPLGYQWYFQGTGISGATNTSYTINNVQTTNIGYYQVMVTNSAGTATSSNATLQIGSLFFADTLDTDTSANWFTAANQADSRATWAFDYSLHADRSGPGVPVNPYYTNATKALKLEANISSGTIINAISVSPKTLGVTGDFQLRFDVWQNWVGPAPNGGTGSTESITAGICHPGNIVEVPQTTLNGGVFIAANGDGGASAASITVPDYAIYTNLNTSGTAQVVSTNTGCYVAVNTGSGQPTWHGNSYYTNITGATPPAIQTATAETNSTLAGAANQTGTIKVGAFGFKWHEIVLRKSGSGTAVTNISWYIDGFRIASVTNAFIPATGTNVSLGYFDAFASLAATNFEFGLFSNVKVESFAGAGVAPAILTQPADAAVSAGANATFSVNATSPTTLRYQWQKDGVNLNNGGSVGGVTSATLTITGAQAGDAGVYRCLVLNDSSHVISAGAGLTINGARLAVPPPSSPSMVKTVIEGQTASFKLTAAGAMSYQWQHEQADLADGGAVSGAKANTLTLTGVTTNDAGDYTQLVTTKDGTSANGLAKLVVISRPLMTVKAVGSEGLVLGAGAPTNATYIIEITDSLTAPAEWTAVVTNIVPVDGVIRFTNSAPGGQQFYRIRFP